MSGFGTPAAVVYWQTWESEILPLSEVSLLDVAVFFFKILK